MSTAPPVATTTTTTTTTKMPGLEDAAIQAAETLQTAHVEPRPSLAHDAAPATAAEAKAPIDHLDTDPDAASDVDEDEIPVSILRPTPRTPQMPPLPDLRFEQSYLPSIKDAPGWRGVAFVTVRDQVGRAWQGMSGSPLPSFFRLPAGFASGVRTGYWRFARERAGESNGVNRERRR